MGTRKKEVVHITNATAEAVAVRIVLDVSSAPAVTVDCTNLKGTDFHAHDCASGSGSVLFLLPFGVNPLSYQFICGLCTPTFCQ